MKERMNITQLEHFLVVAELGNISRAAEKLYITQSALSKSISRLEGELGFALFERTRNGMLLNTKGRILYSFANKMFSDYDLLLRQMRQNASFEDKNVHMCSSVSMLLSLWAENYLKSAPDVRLYIERCSNREILQKLTEGSAELAVTTEALVSPRIQCQPFVTEELVLLVNNDHPFAQLDYVKVEELVREPFYLFGISAGMKETLESYFESLGYSINIAFSSNEPMRKPAHTQDRGIFAMTEHMFSSMEHGGQTTQIRLNLETPCKWTLYLAMRTEPELSPVAKRVFAYIEQETLKYAQGINQYSE